MSVVELMVGIAVGLFVVLAATLVVTTQLNENRRLLLETQLQQDLRASSDIIAREIRRAGSWGAAESGIWYAGRPSPAASNAFPTLELDGTRAIEFEYQRRPGEEGPFGFEVTSGGVIRSQLGDAGWQDLTDSKVMNVSGFVVTLQQTASERLPCPRPCPAGGTDCWPRLIERTVQLDITAASRSDDSVSRTLTTFVRLRNDMVEFNSDGNVCP
jgi:hypothetical protein